jgi:hypothetical protein
MAIFFFDTVVKDPNTGKDVQFGSLSKSAQQQILAEDEAASDAAMSASFRQLKASTGTASYEIATAGYVAGPVTATSGGYSAATGYKPTERTAPDFRGGFAGDQTVASGGGFDPRTGLQQSDSQNSIGGSAAVSQNFNVGADFRGGFAGDQIERSGGGYDPRALEPYTLAPDFNATTTWTGGGYDPDAQAGGYDPTTGYVQGAGNSLGGQAAISETYMGGKDIFAGGYYGEQTEEGGGGYDPSVQGLDDPKNARLAAAGIKEGGEASNPATDPSVSFSTEPDTGNANMDKDWRVRISLSERARFFYNAVEGNELLSPLKKTNGVIFPYTPEIQVSHVANYSPMTPTHSNYAQNFYNNSDVNDITITGNFTVQNIEEGKYLMAAIYFFRAATKMFFGQGVGVGNPPPIVFLDGYGSHYFPHVPCVIKNFSHTLSADVDYMEIPMSVKTLTSTQSGVNPQFADVLPGPNFNINKNTNGATQSITEMTRVPTNSSISITLKPQYSRRNLADRFNLNKFAAGELLRDKTNGYGGFL